MMDEKDLKMELATEAKASDILVLDQYSYSLAGAAILRLDAMTKKIKEYWADPKKKAHEAWKAITAKESEMLLPVESHRKELNFRVKKYLTDQDRARREEQAAIDAAQRKAEDAERAKILASAERAAAKGKDERAADLREKAEAVFVAPAIVQGEVEKTTRIDAGTVSTIADIEITVTDTTEVLRQIIAGKIPISVITLSEAKIKAHVKAWGLTSMPGLTILEVVNARFRGKP